MINSVCFKEFVDDVSAYIFNIIYDSYDLYYNCNEIIIEFKNEDIRMSFRHILLVSENLNDYFYKFKDEFDRRGIKIKLNPKKSNKFLIDEEEFFPSLIENSQIDQKLLNKFLIKKVSGLELRLRKIEKKFNI